MIVSFSILNNIISKHCLAGLLTLCSFSSLIAQDRCGTVDYNKSLQLNDNQEVFENWLSKKINNRKAKILFSQDKAADVVEIPIVFHIIHNGEELGEGLNINDEQIQSQLDVLNEDFRRLNADKANTPSNFVSVAADIQVEFVMAKRDPEGLATNGILRKMGTRSEWSMSDNRSLKELSYWPAEDYLNVWVTAISGTLLGYAQFPISDQLDGLEDASTNRLTDGVVIDNEVFGSIDKYPAADLKNNFNKGRTATHEIGHFLGLRHIWGDESCGTDYCADTPTQRTSNSGCPSHPRSNSCGTSDEMFENFMDYTSDQCMNLFTLDQNDRIRTVIENSPRRQSLTSSSALLDPIIYDNDLGIFNITAPDETTCDKSIRPAITVKNYGTNPLNTAQIKLSLNGNTIETITPDLGVITQLESIIVEFSELAIFEGNNLLEFEILTVNNGIDQSPDNNVYEYSVTLPTIVEADISEDFQNEIENMTIVNTDGTSTWEITEAFDGTLGNKSLFINYFSYENEGTEDWLNSEVMDFTTLPAAQLIFDYSHARYPGNSDQLKVLISTDCGNSYQEIFNKSGEELMTTSSTNTKNFIPASSADWETASLDLSPYIGNSTVLISFVGVNGYGNNIYLDNISLITSTDTSVKLKAIDMPLVTASPTQPLIITVKNTGGLAINDLALTYELDDSTPVEIAIPNLSLNSGQSQQLMIGDISTTTGSHNISVTISKTNGIDDVDVTDNSLSSNFIIDLSSDVIPLRIDFEKENNWVSTTRSDVLWKQLDINGNKSMYVNSAQNINGSAWLFSPVLDLRDEKTASMFFDYAYTLGSSGNKETLKVLLSENGGLDNYPVSLFNKSGADLTTYNQVEDHWQPTNTDQWDSAFIDLSAYAGASEIRLAFQLTNGRGNNFYLDNIEFYSSDNRSPMEIGDKHVTNFPNPIYSETDANFNLIFNLEERQKVKIRIIDLAGNLVFNQTEENALNQTFSYDANGLPNGILILSVVGKTFSYNTRIAVMR